MPRTALPDSASPRRRFVATLAAVATALGLMTAAAVPARADTDTDQIAKWVAGIAVLALIADAVDDKKDRKEKAHRDPVKQPVQGWQGNNWHPQPIHPHPGHGYDQGNGYGQGHGWGNRPPVVVTPARPPVRVEPQLPRLCRVEVRGIRGEHTAYVESCLRGQGIRDRLPKICATPVTIKGRSDRVYGTNCMADLGVYGRQKRRN